MSLELEREEAVQALCAHYAQDHLSTGELETRFDRVYKSSSRAQLQTVLAGLPALKRTVAAPAPMYQVATHSNALPAHQKRYLSVFSGVKKEGAWAPTPLIEAKVLLPPGVGADVDCSAVAGSVEDKAQRALPGAPVVRERGR